MLVEKRCTEITTTNSKNASQETKKYNQKCNHSNKNETNNSILNNSTYTHSRGGHTLWMEEEIMESDYKYLKSLHIFSNSIL